MSLTFKLSLFSSIDLFQMRARIWVTVVPVLYKRVIRTSLYNCFKNKKRWDHKSRPGNNRKCVLLQLKSFLSFFIYHLITRARSIYVSWHMGKFSFINGWFLHSILNLIKKGTLLDAKKWKIFHQFFFLKNLKVRK